MTIVTSLSFSPRRPLLAALKQTHIAEVSDAHQKIRQITAGAAVIGGAPPRALKVVPNERRQATCQIDTSDHFDVSAVRDLGTNK
jgi:hypothetical protein